MPFREITNSLCPIGCKVLINNALNTKIFIMKIAMKNKYKIPIEIDVLTPYFCFCLNHDFTHGKMELLKLLSCRSDGTICFWSSGKKGISNYFLFICLFIPFLRVLWTFYTPVWKRCILLSPKWCISKTFHFSQYNELVQSLQKVLWCPIVIL